MERHEVSDDEVLQAITKIGLDADSAIHFREVRHMLSYNMPLCCIMFHTRLIDNMPSVGVDAIDTLMDDNGMLGSLAFFLVEEFKYYCWVSDKAEELGIKLNYTPCPSCALAGKFVELPEGCSCCHDKEEYPAPDDLDDNMDDNMDDTMDDEFDDDD